MWEREKYAQNELGLRVQLGNQLGQPEKWTGNKGDKWGFNAHGPVYIYRVHPDDEEKYSEACRKVGNYVLAVASNGNGWKRYYKIIELDPNDPLRLKIDGGPHGHLWFVLTPDTGIAKWHFIFDKFDLTDQLNGLVKPGQVKAVPPVVKKNVRFLNRGE